MNDPERTKRDVVARQERMLRLAERDHGLTIKVLHAETGLSLSTLVSWKRDVAMPAWALVALCRVIPDDLTSLLFEPADKCISSCDPADGAEAAIANDAAEFNVEYLRATDPRGDGGATITPRERARLNDIHRRMKARRIAA